MKKEQEKELEIALTSYISLGHNQDECIGFIDGFKEALSLFAVTISTTVDKIETKYIDLKLKKIK